MFENMHLHLIPYVDDSGKGQVAIVPSADRINGDQLLSQFSDALRENAIDGVSFKPEDAEELLRWLRSRSDSVVVLKVPVTTPAASIPYDRLHTDLKVRALVSRWA